MVVAIFPYTVLLHFSLSLVSAKDRVSFFFCCFGSPWFGLVWFLVVGRGFGGEYFVVKTHVTQDVFFLILNPRQQLLID